MQLEGGNVDIGGWPGAEDMFSPTTRQLYRRPSSIQDIYMIMLESEYKRLMMD